MEDYLKEFRSFSKVHQFEERYAQDITPESFFGFPIESIVEAEKKLFSKEVPSVAYFSMEYGLATSFYNSFQSSKIVNRLNELPSQEIFSNMRIRDYYFSFRLNHDIIDLPLYSGGLGVLAGDTLKSAADLGIPLVGIGILWSKGYFKQNFWFKYGQVPEELSWDPYSYPGLVPLETIIKISLKDEDLYLRLWKYYVYSFDKRHVVPLILMDSNLKENKPESRRLTDQLYRSDNPYINIMQRVLLGMGGIKALEELGYSIDKYHLNEGHAAMAFVEKAKELDENELDTLEKNFIYTCHTPVAAGHDRFPIAKLKKILPDKNVEFIEKYGMEDNSVASLTLLLMNCCRHINAVSKKHCEVTRLQFPDHAEKIQSITNGIHIPTWVSEDIEAMLKKYEIHIGDCRDNPEVLKNLDRLRGNEQFRLDLWEAHQANKRRLCGIFERWDIKENAFTICWARRIAAYKRPSLIFQNPQRLIEIAQRTGPIQLLIAGKAHPNDNLVGTYINEIMNVIDSLGTHNSILRIIMLENYDIFFGKILTNCVDVWLNNPLPPFEASGTSGMKAILNGVLQLSTLDGWVTEVADKQIGEIFGYKHLSGQPIGNELELHLKSDSNELYNALEKLTKLYYDSFESGRIKVDSKWLDIMINCIIQSHYFNTYRMLSEYRDKMWFENSRPATAASEK